MTSPSNTEWKFDLYLLSATVREIMRERGMKPDELAHALGDRSGEWVQWFLNPQPKKTVMMTDTLMTVCNVFRLNPCAFFHENVYHRTGDQ